MLVGSSTDEKRGNRMRTQGVAEHILAKIDAIVQSGDLVNEDASPLPPGKLPGNPKSATIQSKARDRLKVLTNTLDSVNRYASNEPPEIVTKIIFGVNEDDIR
jgi:hypothetical protein